MIPFLAGNVRRDGGGVRVRLQRFDGLGLEGGKMDGGGNTSMTERRATQEAVHARVN